MEDKEWIQSLKAGDEVFIYRTGMGQKYEQAKVSRITKTQIIIDFGRYDKRFKRDTGKLVGGSAWYSEYVTKPTDELWEKIAVMGLMSKVNAIRGQLKTPTDRATLEALISALAPFVKS